MEDLTYRILYDVNPNTGLPRKLYLGQATTGVVREGKNKIKVWAETIEKNGVWDVGEPFGFVRDVDVSWRHGEAEVELTEVSPVFARVQIVKESGSSDSAVESNDRTYWFGSESMDGVNDTTLTLSGGQKERVRVIRTAVNGETLWEGSGSISLSDRVLVDKTIDLGVRTYLHEGDVLNDDEFDIDWAHFDEILAAPYVSAGVVDVTNVSYSVVLGNGEFLDESGVDIAKKATNVMVLAVNRHFDPTSARTVPTLGDLGVITAPQPTFSWSMNGNRTYTAFRLRVFAEDGATVIYDSGIRDMPAASKLSGDTVAHYEWQMPFGVGDKMPGTGKVFENRKSYRWQIQAYNAKFQKDASKAPYGSFYMNVAESGPSVGVATVWVRYFGPSETWSGKYAANGTIRVQAFASPDFTGTPIASGYVTDTSILSSTAVSSTNNATIYGIKPGTWYFRAFVDANDNGICDKWESSGWLCGRGSTGTSPFNPVAVSFSSDNVCSPTPFTIWLEDTDIDNDGLPDGWEYGIKGSLDELGIEELDEQLQCNVVLKSKLSADLKAREGDNTTTAAIAGKVLSAVSNAGTASLMLGINPEDGAVAALTAATETKVDGKTLKITSVDLDRLTRKLTLSVEAELDSDAAESADSALYSFYVEDEKTVTCRVLRKTALDDDKWETVATQTVVLGLEADTVSVDLGDDVDLNSGFFSIEIDE